MRVLLYDNQDSTLQHFGILGMKWGVRRKRNKDGTYTKLSPSEINKQPKSRRSRRKALKTMSTEELRSRLNRLKMEKEYMTLTGENIDQGSKFVSNVMKKFGTVAVTEFATSLAKKSGNVAATALTKKLSKVLVGEKDKDKEKKKKES